jgi:hypothetical protein
VTYTEYRGRATKYKGVQMKSRLEARWAMFFDALGVSWKYEPDLFLLPSGKYLPDFRLQWASGHALWVEVKPTEEVLTARDKARYKDFAESRVLLLLDGPPAARSYRRADQLTNRGEGVVLLPTGPQYVMTVDGSPFDMTEVRQAAELACKAKFLKRKSSF